MDYSTPYNFTNQNLQNRSFQGKILNDADFSGADVRGCNFKNAQLQGANFQGAKIGLSRRQIAILSSIAIGICLVCGDTITRLILGTQGEVPNSQSWSFVMLLYGVLSIGGFASAMGNIHNKNSKYGGFTSTVSAIISGALLGFFYAGSATDNNSQAALAGMAIGGLSMFFVSRRIRAQFAIVAIAAAGSVTTYGAAFLLSATASAFLSIHKVFWGTFFSILALVYLWFALVSFSATIREIKNTVGTSFRGANLTNTKFDQLG
jgi:uncharacterized protein YjbI with pentapeptide repeats